MNHERNGPGGGTASAGEPATLQRRLAAACYDALVLGGILMATSLALIVARGGAAVPAGNHIFQLFLVMQVAAYYSGFWWLGQTPGMRAWHLRVLGPGGGRLSPGTAALRLVAALLAVGAAGLGVLWILVDDQRRAWHDIMSGSRVVYVRHRGR